MEQVVLPRPPAPLQTVSDNNILPRWLRFMERLTRDGKISEIRGLKNEISNAELELRSYTQAVEGHRNDIRRLKQSLDELRQLKEYDDAFFMGRFEALMASPHVVGTRIGQFGELIVLVDPVSSEDDLHYAGVYEIGIDLFEGGTITAVHFDRRLETVLYGRTTVYGRRSLHKFSARHLMHSSREALSEYDIAKVVDLFVTHMAYLVPTEAWKEMPDRSASYPWSGHVSDPIRALQQLGECVGVRTKEHQIHEIESSIESLEGQSKLYLERIRHLRKTVREGKLRLTRLESTEVEGFDRDEAQQSLWYISHLDGVTAITFDYDDTPVLHVRNSAVIHGRRYDLGDFELRLSKGFYYFGEGLKVIQTRVPLGGMYRAGWHPDGYNTRSGGFCFGNRNQEILNAFDRGDIRHAVNVALGTMNSISESDEYHLEQFQEIPIGTVWKRRTRRRQRRSKRGTTPLAVS